jgi:hypothetical protein
MPPPQVQQRAPRQRQDGPPPATVGEVLAVVGICFGGAIGVSFGVLTHGLRLHGGRDGGSLLALVAMELLLASLAFALLRRRGYSVAMLLPVPHWPGSVLGALLGLVTLGAWMLGWNLLAEFGWALPSAPTEAANVVPAAGPVAAPALVVLAALVNGVYDEAFLVGYLVRGLRRHGLAVAVGASVMVRLLAHAYQGPAGAIAAVLNGTLLGLFYWCTGQLWPVAFAHILQDLLAFGV